MYYYKMSDDEITGWKLLRVCYSWENCAWGIYEQTPDNKLVFVEGFWEIEPDAHARLEELNKQQGVEL